MKTQQSGFTLIELVIVIVILGVLAATALPKFVNIGSDARIASVKALDGSMRAANSIVYAKAVTANQLGATGSVTINGTAVATVYGFAKDGTNVALAMDLSSDYTVAAGLISIASATTPATCSVTYTAATATASPVYTDANGGC